MSLFEKKNNKMVIILIFYNYEMEVRFQGGSNFGRKEKSPSRCSDRGFDRG